MSLPREQPLPGCRFITGALLRRSVARMAVAEAPAVQWLVDRGVTIWLRPRRKVTMDWLLSDEGQACEQLAASYARLEDAGWMQLGTTTSGGRVLWRAADA